MGRRKNLHRPPPTHPIICKQSIINSTVKIYTEHPKEKSQKLHTVRTTFFLCVFMEVVLTDSEDKTHKEKTAQNYAFAFSLSPALHRCSSQTPNSILRILVCGLLIAAKKDTVRSGGIGRPELSGNRLRRFAHKVRSPSILFPQGYTRIDLFRNEKGSLSPFVRGRWL